jgi:HEAT repeat protein
MRHFSLLFVFLTCSIATEAWACSCRGPETPKEAFDKAKAVFTTHVPEFIKGEQGYVEKVILKIDKVWKGNPDKESIVVNPNEQCAYYNFKENKKYIVYAHSSWDKNIPDSYHVSGCSRTKPLDEGKIETRYLDAIIASKDTKAIDQSLPSILKNKEEKNNIRIEATRLLGWILRIDFEGAPEGAVEALVKASGSGNVELKLSVAHNLSHYKLKGRTDVKGALLQLLKDGDQNVRNAAAGALAVTANHESPDVFKALIQALDEARLKQWNDKKLYETALAALGVSISKVANTEKEKTEAVEILYGMIDEISDPYRKVSVIQHLGFQKERAARTAPKLLEVLKATDSYHVKQYTISALGDIKATDALEEIKPYIKDKNCYVVKHTVEAVQKIAPEGFPEFFRNMAMPEMKTRFESCRHQFIWALQALGPAAKDMKPFLVKKYKTTRETGWRKEDLKDAIDKLQ